jgi:hypothetical protein
MYSRKLGTMTEPVELESFEELGAHFMNQFRSLFPEMFKGPI